MVDWLRSDSKCTNGNLSHLLTVHCVYVILLASLHELGIEDGHIPDQSMTASSRLDNNHGAGRGRLNQGPTGSQGTAWCAGETENNQYLQIDLSKYNHHNVYV